MTPSLIASNTFRIKTTFFDGLNENTGTGTGFWLRDYTPKTEPHFSHPVFVTNKHNVDPSLMYPKKPEARLLKVGLEWGDRIRSSQSPTEFYPIPEEEWHIWTHPTSDCAIVCCPELQERHAIKPKGIPMHELAQAGSFGPEWHFEITDTVYFIGFPGFQGVKLWDETTNLPIARMASIASLPHGDHKHPGIPTGDVVLVSGFSFSGSSGSPVVSLHKTEFPPPELGGPSFKDAWIRGPQLVGIMSGHLLLPDETEGAKVLRHAGLSYFTRSSSILALLDYVRNQL